MIDRKLFIKLFNKHNLDTLFYDVVDCNSYTELDNFFIYVDHEMDQVTILERGSLCGISWYKYMHPGRALELSRISNKKVLDNFLHILAEELAAKSIEADLRKQRGRTAPNSLDEETTLDYQKALDHIGEYAYEHDLYNSINKLQDLIDNVKELEKDLNICYHTINNYEQDISGYEKVLDKACEKLEMYHKALYNLVAELNISYFGTPKTELFPMWKTKEEWKELLLKEN